MRMSSLGLVAALAGVAALPTFGADINILWYTGGVEATTAGSYDAAVNNLVSQEESAFNVSGSINTWNVTFWSGGAMPAGSYNVLVSASQTGGWSSNPNYTALTGAISGAGGASSFFGNRVMLTGQDADWHYIFGPGHATFDGPAGFLIDAINWAGSGTGMGGVILDGTSFMYSTFAGSGSNLGANNTVNIPPAYASFPINTGLSSAGLSNWDTSAHNTFNGADTTLWTPINVNGASDPITIVSAATAGGGTSGGGVPEASSTLGLTFLGVVFLFGFARLARRPVAC